MMVRSQERFQFYIVRLEPLLHQMKTLIWMFQFYIVRLELARNVGVSSWLLGFNSI